jgi:hypothetical protein
MRDSGSGPNGCEVFTRQHHAPHSYIDVAGPLHIIPARERKLLVVKRGGSDVVVREGGALCVEFRSCHIFGAGLDIVSDST